MRDPLKCFNTVVRPKTLTPEDLASFLCLYFIFCFLCKFSIHMFSTIFFLSWYYYLWYCYVHVYIEAGFLYFLKQLVRNKTRLEKKTTDKNGFHRNQFRCRLFTKVESFYLKTLKGLNSRLKKFIAEITMKHGWYFILFSSQIPSINV